MKKSINLENDGREKGHIRRRWGCCMIHDVLRPQFLNINHKRVCRIYTAEGLSIRKRKKTKRTGVAVFAHLLAVAQQAPAQIQ